MYFIPLEASVLIGEKIGCFTKGVHKKDGLFLVESRNSEYNQVYTHTMPVIFDVHWYIFSCTNVNLSDTQYINIILFLAQF